MRASHYLLVSSSLILDHSSRQGRPTPVRCRASLALAPLYSPPLIPISLPVLRQLVLTNFISRSEEVVRRRRRRKRKNLQNPSKLRCLVLVDASTAVDVRLSFPDRSPLSLVRALSPPHHSVPASICSLFFLFFPPILCA
jgi:hypothetical protein